MSPNPQFLLNFCIILAIFSFICFTPVCMGEISVRVTACPLSKPLILPILMSVTMLSCMVLNLRACYILLIFSPLMAYQGLNVTHQLCGWVDFVTSNNNGYWNFWAVSMLSRQTMFLSSNANCFNRIVWHFKEANVLEILLGSSDLGIHFILPGRYDLGIYKLQRFQLHEVSASNIKES